MYKILKDYLKKTGDLAIINTSFNKHEEPIVESIEDAISAL
jgi:carbamoyltransferase